MAVKQSNPMYMENLWRPAYEYYSALAWCVSAIVTYIVGGLYYPAYNLHTWVALSVLSIGVYRGVDAYRLINWQVFLHLDNVLKTSPEWLIKKIDSDPYYYYLGKGFKWGAEHAQRSHQLMGMSSEMSELEIPYPFSKMAEGIRKSSKEKNGDAWIHGIGKEQDIFQNVSGLAGHTMVFGTTGAGKTRLMEVLTMQSIHRGDTVICVDPKGDKDWENRLKKELKRLGRENDFLKFSPAHESESVRINPLKNYTRIGELASRITELMEGGKDSGPFVAFSWKVLNQIIGGMVAAGERPTLFRIKQYLQGDKGILLEKIMSYHMAGAGIEDWKNQYEGRVRELGKNNRSAGIFLLYKELVKSKIITPNEELEGVWTLITHNQDNMMAMTASLLPVMEKLTAGPLRKLFSITVEDLTDPRPVIDMMKVVRSGKVLYIALDSLSDSTVGSAIGGILLADIVSVAGARYNYGNAGNRQVSIYVDEAAEVVNKPFIQLLNKGRGAKFSCTFASQTMSDFESKLGNEAEARKILGNANNLIALRLTDKTTLDFCAESFGKTTIKTTMQTTSTNAGTGSEMANWSGGYGERLIPTESDLFPSNLISKLPNLQYIFRSADGSIIKGRLPFFTDIKWVPHKGKK